jgi:hypothetical protein
VLPLPLLLLLPAPPPPLLLLRLPPLLPLLPPPLLLLPLLPPPPPLLLLLLLPGLLPETNPREPVEGWTPFGCVVAACPDAPAVALASNTYAMSVMRPCINCFHAFCMTCSRCPSIPPQASPLA